MSVRIVVSRNFGSLADLQLVDAEIMRQLGLQAREIIVRRTRAGLGPDGPLAPLSAKYAQRKLAALGTAEPDLTVSGNMLNHIGITHVEVTDERAGVELGFVT